MKLKHALMALLVAAIWGFNFVVIRAGLGGIPPFLLAALRFVIAVIPAFFLPRPNVPWPRMIAIAMTMFVGQFGFLFTAMTHGMPPGLASVTLQSQALFTILIAALVLRERPTARQLAGVVLALGGLGVIASTVGHGLDVSALGLGLIVCSALSWATGTVLLRQVGKVDMLPMISWLSFIPPLPLLALSLIFEGPERIGHALVTISWLSIGSVVYIGLISTIVGFALWGHLFKLYPAAVVAPFALLIPIFGTVSAALVYGETFSPVRLGGMALVFAGLAIAVVPLTWLIRIKKSA